MAEEYEEGGANYSRISKLTKAPNALNDVKQIEFGGIEDFTNDFPRIKTDIEEFDRCLGGGLVPASVVLIAGDPGIGKSTLLLQTAAAYAKKGQQVIYISGEESLNQIRLRAKRLGIKSDAIKLASATNLTQIIASVSALNSNKNSSLPNQVLIIDSIQTIFLDEISSAPGTVSQVRAAAAELGNFAKTHNISLLIVSHVTKEGQIAGPKVLEHMVDTVLYFEGERDLHFRILRATKNRFGAASEIGVFEMSEAGLREIKNPSELFLTSYEHQTSGTAIFAQIEGSRTILVEVQALISPSFMPLPKRSAVGLDSNRLSMIIAVLNSRFGLSLFNKEVYLNVVGGIKITETAADLAIALALISAARDVPLPEHTLAIGEIGLTGEVRMVGNLESRVKEAAKLGFKNCLFPKANQQQKGWSNLKKLESEIKLIPISHIRDITKNKVIN